jgi:3-oxoacyl-[acyl-carrier protein] reductase
MQKKEDNPTNRREGVMKIERIALVTGAARGVGKATALKFAEQGCKLAVFDRDIARLMETTKEIEENGGICKPWQVDISDSLQVEKGIAEVIDTFGRIDILANIAGIIIMRKFINTTVEEFDKVISVNLRGTFLMMKAVLPQMMNQRSGHVINVASVSANSGYSFHSSYSASKAGVLRLTEAAADELHSYNIHINAVSPMGIATDLFGPKIQHLDRSKWIQPGDVAEVIAFLASPESNQITGTSVSINGMYKVSVDEVKSYLELGENESAT